MMSQKDLYEKYHDNPAFHNIGSSTFKGDLVSSIYGRSVNTVLDFGCGTGYAVRGLRNLGYEAYGYEYSRVAFEKYGLDGDGIYFNRIEDVIGKKFDLLYSTEVLEHIPEDLIDFYVDFFSRICSRRVFMTISLRPSSDNNAYHCTLKPRAWWESHFIRHGFIVDSDVVSRCQTRGQRSTKQILSQWKGIGEFGVKFADNPPYELNGEEQPWFFAFRKK